MRGFFPIRWSADGIAYHLNARVWALEALDDPLLTSDMNAIVLRWGDRWSLSLVEPWPCATIRWEGGEIGLSPRRLLGHASPEEFADRLEALVLHIEGRSPARVADRAWLDVPEEPWEPAPRMPEPASDVAVGDGAFRSAVPRADEVALALSAPPSAFDTMLAWLASSPSRPFREHPRELRASDAFLYARRRDGSVWRVPLASLRKRGLGAADAVYVFGRRTTVLLPDRPGCPVRALLDRRLARPVSSDEGPAKE